MSRMRAPKPAQRSEKSRATGLVSIAFAEEEEAYRTSLEASIRATGRYHVVGSFNSLKAALAGLRSRGPYIIVLDIPMAGHSGIAAIARLRTRWPHTRWVMLTNSESEEDLLAALKAGASGFLQKSDSAAQILAALDELVAGGAPLSRPVALRLLASFTKAAEPPDRAAVSVTPREREIMDQLAQGQTYKEIARKLGISGATVKNHLYKIYEKLGVRSRTEAAVKWLKS